MSEYQSTKIYIFSKGYAPNWIEEIFVVKKKILYLGLMKLVI